MLPVITYKIRLIQLEYRESADPCTAPELGAGQAGQHAGQLGQQHIQGQGGEGLLPHCLGPAVSLRAFKFQTWAVKSRMEVPTGTKAASS